MAKCQALNAAGKPCGMPALRGGPFCVRHSEKARPGNIVEALRSPRYFRGAFRSLETWKNWETFLKAAYNIPLGPDELAFFKKCTGRESPLPRYSEIVAEIGRQGGKTSIAGLMAAWAAVGEGWEGKVSPGEQWNIVVVSNTKAQSRLCFGQIRRLLKPFRSLVERDRSNDDEIVLANGCHVVIRSSDDKSIRGWGNIVLAICDESQYFENDSVGSVINALVPAIREGGRLLCISSQNGSRGYVQDMRREHFGEQDCQTLVWVARTVEMNLAFDPAKIERDVRRDPSIASEYDPWVSQRDAALFPESMLRRNLLREPTPYDPRRRYTAAIDMSSGLNDQATLAVVSPWREIVRVDALVAYDSPFDFVDVMERFANVLNDYKVREVFADRHAHGQLESTLARRGIRVEPSDADKSVHYLRLRELLEQGCVALVDDSRLIEELRRLQIKKTQTGRRVVYHPKNYFDDRADVVASAVWHLGKRFERQPTPGAIVQRRAHPIQTQEKERHVREELDESEEIMRKYMTDTEWGVCTPLRDGEVPETIENMAKRKIKRPPVDHPV